MCFVFGLWPPQTISSSSNKHFGFWTHCRCYSYMAGPDGKSPNFPCRFIAAKIIKLNGGPRGPHISSPEGGGSLNSPRNSKNQRIREDCMELLTTSQWHWNPWDWGLAVGVCSPTIAIPITIWESFFIPVIGSSPISPTLLGDALGFRVYLTTLSSVT